MIKFNPLMRSVEKTLAQEETVTASTYKGIIVKTFMLFSITLVIATLFSIFGIIGVRNLLGDNKINLVMSPRTVMIVLGVSVVTAFITGLIGSFAPKSCNVVGPIYAVSEGVILGAVTTLIAIYMPAIAIAASASTLGLFLISLFFHLSSRFRTKQKAAKFFSIFGVSLLFAVLTLVILRFSLPLLFTNPTLSVNIWLIISIFISIIFIILGLLSLLQNFQYANLLVQNEVDKRYEMSVAFGILITLIWMYLEFIRLILLIISLTRHD